MKLTQADLDAIKDLIGITLDDALEAKLNEKLSHLPTKEEFYAKMDEVMKELKDIREEHTVISDQVPDIIDRLTALESTPAAN